MEDLKAEVEYKDDAIGVIRAEGYIDTITVSVMEKVLQEVLKKPVYKIVVDLTNVNYVSSAGWGVFVSELKNIRDNKGDLVLTGMSPEVYDVYDLMEFSTILNSYENLEEALTYFKNKSG